MKKDLNLDFSLHFNDKQNQRVVLEYKWTSRLFNRVDPRRLSLRLITIIHPCFLENSIFNNIHTYTNLLALLTMYTDFSLIGIFKSYISNYSFVLGQIL